MSIRSPYLLLVLLAFALRALVPIGFMPATDGSFSLVICDDGLPAGFLRGGRVGAMPGGMGMPGQQSQGPGHQRQGGHGDADNGHCSFCTGFSAAPPGPLLTALLVLLAAIILRIATSRPAPAGIRRVHLPQARAPPTFC